MVITEYKDLESLTLNIIDNVKAVDNQRKATLKLLNFDIDRFMKDMEDKPYLFTAILGFEKGGPMTASYIGVNGIVLKLEHRFKDEITGASK